MSSGAFKIQLYENSLQVPPAVISALRSNQPNANCILPTLLKSRIAEGNGEVPPRKQVWIVCSSVGGPCAGIELVLSVTEGYINSYPVFFFVNIPVHELTRDFLQPRIYQMARTLHGAVPEQRVYSVFGPDLVSTVFAWAWTDITGIQNYIERPYYAAKISFCTRQTFRPRPINIHPDLTYEIRPAQVSDIKEIAELCMGFASDSDPFFLTQAGAIREATILVQRSQVWVHRIARKGNSHSEIATIVAFSRNSDSNATITKVYTNPRWRRMGSAERLVREVCDFLLRSKATVSLFVAHDNPGAANVYSRVGFVGLGFQDAHVPGVDSWIEIGFDRNVIQLGHW